MEKIVTKNYTQFKSLLGEAKRSSDPLWCRLILRPMSFPSGWILYKMGVKANSISLFSVLITIIACTIIIFGRSDYILISSFLMILVSLLDCIDGNIARARDEIGPSGEWTDALSGYTIYAILPLSLGIYAYLHNVQLALPELWIIIGAVTSISNLFPRLLYQKFVSIMKSKIEKNSFDNRRSLFSKVSGEMGLVGWMMPALLLASVFDLLGAYLIFYCLFYLMSAIVITIVLFFKIS